MGSDGYRLFVTRYMHTRYGGISVLARGLGCSEEVRGPISGVPRGRQPR
ncbi:MAG TPA: hypothetical protein VGE04_15700 [Chloroflexia bacterium]